ncbi:MAG: heavy metal-associated domain-containing protein [Gemmatimonadaceae bacterium]
MATATKQAKITIPVTGMHCAACQSRVQSALREMPGVRDANVNLMLNNAVVTYDDDAIAPDRLIEAIRSTGYDATLPVEGGGGGPARSTSRRRRSARTPPSTASYGARLRWRSRSPRSRCCSPS